ncbi:hypothetical protein PIB30_072836 [Stylosanthes scabra]|uniref:Transposase-associated domain-containing protein n=1 Tax=Stylosanthes scabra TaxID=79078 RepID=A0ABU6QPV1_9FABA|nr:hypothetical protein [Stylosanthes scabra]
MNVIGLKIEIGTLKSFEEYIRFGKVRCSCTKCKCTKYKNIDDVRVDLLRKGFMSNYKTWVQHGEGTLDDLIRYELGGYDASNEDLTMNSWNENVVRYESMVADAFPQFEMSEDNVEEEQHDPNPNAQREVNKQNRASLTGGSLHTGGSTTYEATRDRMEAFLAELKRLQAERQALMEAGCPEPPPIDEAALWTRFAGGRKRGRIYGMGVVLYHQHPPLFPDDEDADTASAPDLRERVVMLNREISQQAEANARRVAALESTVQTQSQEVSDLQKAYVDMYSLLTQMRNGGSSFAPLPDFPPPPPPPPPPQTDAPGTGPGTGSPDADDDPDYV